MSEVIAATRDARGKLRVHCPWTDADLLISLACHHCPKFVGELGGPFVVCAHTVVDVSLDDVHRDLTAPPPSEWGDDEEVIRLGGREDGATKLADRG